MKSRHKRAKRQARIARQGDEGYWERRAESDRSLSITYFNRRPLDYSATGPRGLLVPHEDKPTGLSDDENPGYVIR